MAFEQLQKILPFTHDILSTTSFVMPNSYSYNLESGMDGESMSDWYTGSANTLIKALVRGLFGINPTLDGVIIKPTSYFASESAKCSMMVKGKNLSIEYDGGEVTKISVNGIVYDYKEIYISNELINSSKEIIIKLF